MGKNAYAHCPWCETNKYLSVKRNGDIHYVKCARCGAKGPSNTKDWFLAVSDWNGRKHEDNNWGKTKW